MRYPQKTSIVGLIIGMFGLLQFAVGVLFVLSHYELIDIEVMFYDNEIAMYILTFVFSQLPESVFSFDTYLILGIAVMLNGCVFIAFYSVLNKVNQTNAMVRRIFDRVNK